MGLQEETAPSARSVIAAVRLLADEDEKVRRACRSQLLLWGDIVEGPLKIAAEDDDPRLRMRARDLQRSLELRRWLERLCSFAGSAEGSWNNRLFEGLMLAASVDRGDRAGSDAASSTIGELGRMLAPRVEGRSTHTSARHLTNLLAGEFGLDGCREGFHRRDNLHLDRILQQRRGLPSALVAIYLLVARSAGLVASPVRLPDYYLLRIHGRRNVLLDPFHGGRTVTKADCLRYMRESGHPDASLDLLEDIDERELLAGVLEDMRRTCHRPTERELRVVLGEARTALVS